MVGSQIYSLTLSDAYADGFCCDYGRGFFLYDVGGMKDYETLDWRTFTNKEEKTFYVGMPLAPVLPPNGGDGDRPFSGRGDDGCRGNQRRIRIKFVTGKYGAKNSWSLVDAATNLPVCKQELGYYGAFSEDNVSVCVPHRNHKFVLTDGISDGIC